MSTVSRKSSWSLSENLSASLAGKKSSLSFLSAAKPSSDSHSSRINFFIAMTDSGRTVEDSQIEPRDVNPISTKGRPLVMTTIPAAPLTSAGILTAAGRADVITRKDRHMVFELELPARLQPRGLTRAIEMMYIIF